MNNKNVGIMPIILLLLSLPIGSGLGVLLLNLIDLTPIMQDIFISLSIIVCIAASLVVYKTFTKKD